MAAMQPSADPVPAAGQPSPAPRTWSFHFTFSWDGPGLPDRAGTLEFLRSLNRRDLAIAAGALLLVFVIEPLILFWIFSARLRSQLDRQAVSLAAAVSSQVQSEVGSVVMGALSQQQQRLITPLNASDPTALVLPSSANPPPPGGKAK